MGTIRLLLALSVVIAHAVPLFGLTLVGGKLAVQSFFVISGFYMSLILSEKYPSGVAGTWLFYGNRFLRIYPLYWIALLLSVAAFACVWAISSVAPNFADSFAKLDIIRQAVPKFSLDQIIFWLISNVSLLGMDLRLFHALRRRPSRTHIELGFSSPLASRSLLRSAGVDPRH
jgi:peptidoglycan/LPS O-acetylase OafA/YrhL